MRWQCDQLARAVARARWVSLALCARLSSSARSVSALRESEVIERIRSTVIDPTTDSDVISLGIVHVSLCLIDGFVSYLTGHCSRVLQSRMIEPILR